jgi:hypothetical protein
MRRFHTLALLSAWLLAACEAPAPTLPTAESGPPALNLSSASCGNVSGTVTAAFVQGQDWQIEGTLFDDTGAVLGDAFAWIDDLEPRGDGAIGIRMRHRYEIGGGAFETMDQGVLSPIAPPEYWFNNRLEVVGGEGDLEGARGMIRSHGTVDLGSGDIFLAYHGRLCVG